MSGYGDGELLAIGMGQDRWVMGACRSLQSLASATDAPWVTSDADDGASTTKVMRLRYAGRCRTCGQTLSAGISAEYDRASKSVQCLGCTATPASSVSPAPAPVEERSLAGDGDASHAGEPEVIFGMAGASARREYERRSAKREDRVRAAHPKIGGFLLAISEEPQSTTAWAVGARGEALLGKGLDGLASRGVRVLHDRRTPRTRANIDHVAVSSSGVFVIDGVDILWPKKATEHLLEPGDVDEALAERIHRTLATAFPKA